MITRCTNSKCRFYYLYGGRGITVCERWRVFENFLADMGERPSGLTIGRIDGDKGYYPENCRWETWLQQGQNTSRIVKVTIRGITGCMAQVCRHFRIKRCAVQHYIDKGIPVEEAFEISIARSLRRNAII